MKNEITLDDGMCISLREYIERIFDEREKTLDLTAKNLEHRLDTLNALRADVIKDRELFLTKAVYNEMHTALVSKVVTLERMQSRMIGVGIALVAGAGLIGAFLSHILKIQ